MIFISKNISLKEDELTFKAVRASGPGGQHVNATSSAIHLQFDAKACEAISPAMLKRLAGEAGRRLSATGILTLRAEAHSSQHRNRDDALARLKSLLLKAEKPKKYRAKTRPTRASNERRLASKTQRSTRKQTRGKVKFTD